MSCPSCRSPSASPCYPVWAPDQPPRAIMQCGECGGYFLSPQPTAAELNDAYSADYYGERSTKFAGPLHELFQLSANARSRRIHRLLAERPSTIVDIGCGDGAVLAQLADLGHRCIGIERAGPALERARRRSAISVVEDVERLNSTVHGAVDLICLWHVFEHLEHPREMLERIVPLLRPDGLLLIALPNIESVQSRMFRGRWFHLDPPRHLFFLGPQGAAAEFARYGLEVRAIKTFSFQQNIFGYVQSTLNLVNPHRERLYGLMKGRAPQCPGEMGRTILEAASLSFILPAALLAASIEGAIGRGGTLDMVLARTTAPATGRCADSDGSTAGG